MKIVYSQSKDCVTKMAHSLNVGHERLQKRTALPVTDIKHKELNFYSLNFIS